MPLLTTRITESIAQSELAETLALLHAEFDPGFTDDVLDEAAAAEPESLGTRVDLRHLPFATLDPAESMDLDQAFQLERAGDGYIVRYAIADVPAFVRAGGAVDLEARSRGTTLYAADGNIPLHPTVLSEGHASLLPNVERSAIVWSFDLDAEGAVKTFEVFRATIKSVAKLDYETTQADLDAGRPSLAELLPEIGKLRILQEAKRGGASLNMPESEVVQQPDGTYTIVRRHPLPIEDYNAQLSLMTGMAAAELMLKHKIGIIRTMPEPNQYAFDTFRHKTKALHRPWKQGNYGDYLRTLDHADSQTLPILEAAGALFRGSGYEAFDGEVPADPIQAAVAAPYAHVTAPLRRLVDRWTLAICVALGNDQPVPDWVRESMFEVPGLMQEASGRSAALTSKTRQCVEAALLAPYVGQDFEVTVIARRSDTRAVVQLENPPVENSAPVPESVQPGEQTTVRLVRTDVAAGLIEFATPDHVDPRTSPDATQKLRKKVRGAEETARVDVEAPESQ